MKITNIAELHTADLYKQLKRLKSEKIINAVLIGFSVGVFAYSVFKSGLNISTCLCFVALYLFYTNARKRNQMEKEVQSEITKRGAV